MTYLTQDESTISGYKLAIRPELLENPDTIANVDVTLPGGGGLTARFIRSGAWLPFKKEARE